MSEERCDHTDLFVSQCACPVHYRGDAEAVLAVVNDEPDPDTRPERVGSCDRCGKPLTRGRTVAAIFCSWVCSWAS